jgi:hypothetical protein
VTPNESRAFPTVWLRGDPSGKPQYQFFNDPSRREIVFNERPAAGTTLESRELHDLREDRERLIAVREEDAQSDAAARAKAPEECTAASTDATAALACAAPARPQ